MIMSKGSAVDNVKSPKRISDQVNDLSGSEQKKSKTSIDGCSPSRSSVRDTQSALVGIILEHDGKRVFVSYEDAAPKGGDQIIPECHRWEELGQHSRRCLCNGKGPRFTLDASYEIKCTSSKTSWLYSKQGSKERSNSCLRALAFMHRGVKSYHCKWDLHAGDMMLMLSGLSLRSAGQIKVRLRSRKLYCNQSMSTF